MSQIKLSLRCERGQKCSSALRKRICDAASAVLREENLQEPCELSVLITDDEGIREINRQFRNLDSATDVLSFPMGDRDPGTGRLLLGDMVLNRQRAEEQGTAFGHGPDHEISYLTVHSVLHMLGYDHMDDEEKRRMREREKAVMAVLEPDTCLEE